MYSLSIMKTKTLHFSTDVIINVSERLYFLQILEYHAKSTMACYYSGVSRLFSSYVCNLGTYMHKKIAFYFVLLLLTVIYMYSSST